MPERTAVTVRLPPALAAQLKKLGKQQDRSVNWLIVQAVKEYVERNHIPPSNR